jgi:hypothetical protein
MAVPLTADQLIAALVAEGVNVAQRAGWRTHNRNHIGPWGPVNGVVIHHTAGVDSLEFCWSGSSTLPGPVCHTHLAKSGLATMVGHGRVNHAGTFAENAHTAVVLEAAVHPRPDGVEPVDGNRHYYGIEIENRGDGKDPYPAEQYGTAVRWAAAICRAHGWSAHSVIGHKEGTRRKIDPSFDMDVFRDAVAARLAHPASWNPEEEDDMPTAVEIADAVLTRDGKITIPGAASTNPTYTLASTLTEILKRLDKANAALAAQSEANSKLVETVAALVANVGDLDPAAIVTELRDALESITVRLDVPDVA